MKRVKFYISGHFLKSAWREWPVILHSDTSWAPTELIRLRSWSAVFLFSESIWLSEMGQICGFQAFPGERMDGMVWYFTCSCLLTTFRTDYIMYFDLVKGVKFGVSSHFLENAWREWPAILHTVVSWPHSEMISSWSQSVDFSNFGTILT